MSDLIKELTFGEDCQKLLIQGVEKHAKAVKVSMGTHGQTVIIESPNHPNKLLITKDGVSISKSIFLLDPIENMASQIMKEAADRTALDGGDGTTASIVLSEALIKHGVDKIKPELNKTEVLREMVLIGEEVIAQVGSRKLECNDQILLDVAKTSCNNDEKTGTIIAEAYKGVGKDGIVTVEKSPNEITSFEVVDGLKIDRGYTSPMFMNNIDKEAWIANDVHILMCDLEISSHDQIKNILEPIVATKKKLLIIAPCTTGFLNFMVHNYKNNVLDVCIVQPPNFGYKLKEEMEDIAISVGAKFISQQLGDDLSLIKFDDLGFAEKVTVGRKRTIIVNGHGDKEEIEKRANELRSTAKNRTIKHEIEYLTGRIATLVGGVGVIYVGGITDVEQKELHDRVDDAVLAVRSAIEEGIVSGAGKALWEVSINKEPHFSPEKNAAIDIVLAAIKTPLYQILANAGLKVEDYYSDKTPIGHGYNLKTRQQGNLIESGVTDPFKVVRCAFQNALSVAVTILSTSTSIHIVRIND
jgi:chaperonin GroEL